MCSYAFRIAPCYETQREMMAFSFVCLNGPMKLFVLFLTHDICTFKVKYTHEVNAEKSANVE